MRSQVSSCNNWGTTFFYTTDEHLHQFRTKWRLGNAKQLLNEPELTPVVRAEDVQEAPQSDCVMR